LIECCDLFIDDRTHNIEQQGVNIEQQGVNIE